MSKKPPSLWSRMTWCGLRRGLTEWYWDRFTTEGRDYWRNA